MKKTTVLDSESLSNGAASTEDVAALRAKHVMPLPGPMYTRPVQIVRGRMQYLYDETGKQYLDGFAGVATVNLGHCHPHWVKAIQQQMNEYYHTPALYLHPSLGKFAKRLADVAKQANPALDVCFFTNSGSEANDLAALIAKNFTGSHDILCLRHAYHGRTLMTMAMTGLSTWRHSTPYGQSVAFAEANYPYRGVNWKQAVDDLQKTIKTATPGKIAGMWAEPINGVGGLITPEPEYFPAAYELVKKAGGLWVSDEVQTGVGRTGKLFWGIQQFAVKPDIITMAKGLGNGYPIGAVITTQEIAKSMHGKSHYNTFGGGPVQMAAANAVLDVMEQEKLADNAAEIGAYLKSRLGKIQQKSPNVGDVRGMGLMIGIELVKDKKSQEPAPELTLKVMDRTKDAGLLIGKGGLFGNVLRVQPPLCITKKDADFLAETIEAALA